MSSRRRSRSRSRDRKSMSSSKLRMDSKPQTPRITDPSLPSGRRREIDNVMKKARAATNNAYWDKKLLEVEEKDPNRWRHSGYKSLYIDGSSSSSPSRRSRSRSPVTRGRSPRSPPPTRRTPLTRRSPRSPPPRRSSPRRSPPPQTRPRSPATRRSSPPIASRSSRTVRPRSPPPKTSCRRSASASSVSSCSDDSCSVCSPKTRRRGVRTRSHSVSPPPRSRVKAVAGKPTASPKPRSRPRPPSPSPPVTARRVPRPMTPPPVRRQKVPDSEKPTDPRRQPPPPRPRGRTGEIIDVQGVKPPPPKNLTKKKTSDKVLLTRIKKEKTSKKRPGSPAGGGDSSGSDDSSNSSTSAIVATTRLTLSERFGKIAQWSADRERRDMENMRITKSGGDLKVMIEEDAFLYGTPPRRYSLSPIPAGHYPDELLPSGPQRSAAWDDVRVRYQYYKDLGYLRDLSLDDYVKWEEWWYKYQDWLANERHYEHWLSTHGGSGGSGRRRRKRLPASQRLN